MPEPSQDNRAAEESTSDVEPFLVEFGRFLREHKVWWVAPLLLVMLVILAVALMVALTAGPHPFIYPGM